MEEYYQKQLNESYNGRLNELFEEWKASCSESDRAADRFCEDGLTLKYKDVESGYDINAEWERAARRIMFIVKDCPDEWGYDTRMLLVGYPDNEASKINAEKTRNLKGGFFKNMAKMLYGLYNMTEENKGKELNDGAGDIGRLKTLFNEVPFAYVEAKKLAGGKTCNDAVLARTLEEDGQLLAREIGILRPNIIVCCDTNCIIFDSVVRNYFNGIVPDDEHRWVYKYGESPYDFEFRLYYYEEECVLLFNSYHPTSLGKEAWTVSERVYSPFRQFFARYKTFDVVSKPIQR